MVDPIVIYVALGAVIAILSYAVRNLLIRVEKYEDAVEEQVNFINNLSDTIKQSQAHLKELDSKGVFQSDDDIKLAMFWLAAERL